MKGTISALSTNTNLPNGEILFLPFVLEILSFHTELQLHTTELTKENIINR